MSEFTNHVGDYSDLGFKLGVSTSLRQITSRSDDTNIGTFVDADIPNKSYLHSEEGVIIQRDNSVVGTAGVHRIGRDIPFKAFGFTDDMVQAAFEYPNKFKIIPPTDALWQAYDVYFQELTMIGEHLITGPGFYTYILSLDIPEEVSVRWYTEGGLMDKSSDDRQSFSFVVTEDQWRLDSDCEDLHIYCEIEAGSLGKKVLEYTTVFDNMEPAPSEPDVVAKAKYIYPQDVLDPTVENLLGLDASESIGLTKGMRVVWTVQGEKTVVKQVQIARSIPVTTVALTELIDQTNLVNGTISVTVRMDIMKGGCTLASDGKVFPLLKPEVFVPDPEVPPLAVISSEVDLMDLELEDEAFDLSSDKSHISEGYEYDYKWVVKSTEGKFQSTEPNILVQMADVINVDAYEPITGVIQLTVTSRTIPEYTNTATTTFKIIRPITPETPPIARITSDKDLMTLTPESGDVMLKSDTSTVDSRYTYDYVWEITADGIDPIQHVSQSATMNVSEVITGQFGNVPFHVHLSLVSQNNPALRSEDNKDGLITRAEEVAPVAKIVTVPLATTAIDIVNNPDMIITLDGSTSTVVPGVEYEYTWTITEAEKYYTATGIKKEMPIQSVFYPDGFGVDHGWINLEVRSLRTPSLVSTARKAISIGRPAEEEIVARITAAQDLNSPVDVAKVTHLDLSSSTSTLDDRVEYNFDWTVSTPEGNTSSVEKNPSILIADVMDVDSYGGNITATITLTITSKKDSSKRSTATKNVTMARRSEVNPVAQITHDAGDLMALTNTSPAINFSAEDSILVPGVTYDYKWTITGGASIINKTGVDVIVAPSEIMGDSEVEVPFNVKLEVISKKDATKKDTDNVTGKVAYVKTYPIVAGMSGGYASISNSNGITWTALPQGLNSGSTTAVIYALAASDNTFVAGLNGSFASISNDKGKTWSALPKGLGSSSGGSTIWSLEASGDIFVVGMEGGFASRSTDKGKTWNPLIKGLNSGSTVAAIYSLAASDNTFVAGMSSGYASISTDKGATWKPLPRGLNSGSTTSIRSLAASGDIFVAGFDSGFASISTDKGVTWRPLTRGLNCGSTTDAIRSLVASGDTFVAGFDSGYASISTDKGVTWKPLTRGLNSGGAGSGILSIASSGDTLVAGAVGGYASISTDKGKTWNPLPKGLNSGSASAAIWSLAAIQPETPPEAIIKSDIPLDEIQLIGTDTFELSAEDSILSNGNVSGYDYHWVIESTSGVSKSYEGEVITVTTADIAGVTKSTVDFTVTLTLTSKDDASMTDSATANGAISVTPPSGLNIVAGMLSGYASISENDGITWTALEKGLNSGDTSSTIQALAVSGDTFVAGMYNGYASISKDKGKTWTALPQGLNTTVSHIYSMASSGDTFIAGMANGYASISTDKGVNWNPLTRGLNCGSTSSAIDALAASGNTFVAGFNGGYASISTDKGANWKPLTRGLNSGSTSSTIKALAASGDTFVAGMFSGYASISTDKGVTWTALPRGLNCGSMDHIQAIAASGNIFVAGMEGGYASISKDKGKTWTALPRGLNTTVSHIFSMASSGDTFIAGMANGYASISKDRGKNWTELSRGLGCIDTNIYAIAIMQPEQAPDAVIKSTIPLEGLIKDDVFTLSSEDSSLSPGIKYTYAWIVSSEHHVTNFNTATVTDINVADYVGDTNKGSVELTVSLTITSKEDHTKTDTAVEVGSVFCGKIYPIVAGMQGGYASISNNNGITWTALPQGLNSGTAVNINAIASSGDTFVAGMANGYASISKDKGKTWNPLTRGLGSGSTDSDIDALAASGSGEETTFVAGLEGGFTSISEDNGKTWRALPKGLNSGGTTFGVEALAASGDTFVAGMLGGYASISIDKGKNWRALPRGLNCGHTTATIKALAASGNIFVAVTTSGYASISTDKGANWNPLPKDLNVSSPTVQINSLSTLGTGEEVTFIAGMNSGYASISNDKGKTWTALPQGLNSGSISSTIWSLLAASGDIFIAGMFDGYASVSRDKGKTWNPLERGLNCGNTTVDIRALATLQPEIQPVAVITSDVDLDTLTTATPKVTFSAATSTLSPSINYTYEWTTLSAGGTTSTKTTEDTVQTVDFTIEEIVGSVDVEETFTVTLTITSKEDAEKTSTTQDSGIVKFVETYPIVMGMSNGYASISNDNGKTWTALPQGLGSGNLYDINSIASSGGTFVAGMSFGAASISEDKGKTWRALPQGLNSGSTSPTIQALAASGNTFVAGMTSGYASISNDKGKTWTALPQGLNSGSTGTAIYALVTCDNTFVAGMAGGYASISEDKGVTWSPLPRGLGSGSTGIIYSLAAAGNTFVAGMQSGRASISTDKGVTWTALPRGLNSGSTTDAILALSSSGGGADTTFVAGLSGGYASISIDKGVTWNPLKRGLNSGGSTANIQALAASGDTFVAGAVGGYVSISNDKGNNWSGAPKQEETIKVIAALPTPPRLPIVAGMYDGYASISEDSGKTWNPLTKGLNSGDTSSTIQALATSGNTIVAGVENGYASISEDKGVNWTPLTRGLNCGNTSVTVRTLAASGDIFVAGMLGGFASRSTDKGKTWNTLSKGLSCGSTTAAIYALAASGDTLVAGMANGFASRSTDRGATWRKLPQGLNSGSTTATIQALAASGDTFVAGLSNGYASISYDKGATWSPLKRGLNSGSTGANIHALVTCDNTFVAGLNSGYASISNDKGKTWTALPQGLNSGSISSTIWSLAASGDIFVAGMYGGYASISYDKGANWRSLPQGLNSGSGSTGAAIWSLAIIN